MAVTIPLIERSPAVAVIVLMSKTTSADTVRLLPAVIAPVPAVSGAVMETLPPAFRVAELPAVTAPLISTSPFFAVNDVVGAVSVAPTVRLAPAVMLAVSAVSAAPTVRLLPAVMVAVPVVSGEVVETLPPAFRVAELLAVTGPLISKSPLVAVNDVVAAVSVELRVMLLPAVIPAEPAEKGDATEILPPAVKFAELVAVTALLISRSPLMAVKEVVGAVSAAPTVRLLPAVMEALVAVSAASTVTLLPAVIVALSVVSVAPRVILLPAAMVAAPAAKSDVVDMLPPAFKLAELLAVTTPLISKSPSVAVNDVVGAVSTAPTVRSLPAVMIALAAERLEFIKTFLDAPRLADVRADSEPRVTRLPFETAKAICPLVAVMAPVIRSPLAALADTDEPLAAREPDRDETLMLTLPVPPLAIMLPAAESTPPLTAIAPEPVGLRFTFALAPLATMEAAGDRFIERVLLALLLCTVTLPCSELKVPFTLSTGVVMEIASATKDTPVFTVMLDEAELFNDMVPPTADALEVITRLPPSADRLRIPLDELMLPASSPPAPVDMSTVFPEAVSKPVIDPAPESKTELVAEFKRIVPV